MAEIGESTDPNEARLEAALARIERAHTLSPARLPPHAKEAGLEHHALRGRLDTLIAELRAVLGRDSPD